MIKTLIAAVTGTLLATTAPAFAEGKPDVTTATQSQTAVKDTDSAQRYCVRVAPTTGTMLTRRECLTRDAWLAKGFDPLKK